MGAGGISSRKGACIKLPRFDALSNNAKSMPLKIFPTDGGTYKSEQKINKYSGEI